MVCWSDESLGSMTFVSAERARGDLDAARLGPCRHGEGYGQHPVLIGGGDVVGVDVLTEGQATHVTAGEALGTQPLHVVFGPFAALCRHGEDAAINADVHRTGSTPARSA